MIPAPWYIRFLPHIAIVIAVLTGVWYLQHIGYERAQRDRDAADAKMLAAVQQSIIASERRSAERENGRGVMLGKRLDAIAQSAATGRERIIKEMTHETRFIDPALGIPLSVRDEINRALAASACAARPDGSIVCAVRDGGGAGEH